MTQGYLWYNSAEKRYGVIDNHDLWAIEGLHCGMCMEVELNGRWTPTRIEYSDSTGWFLVGLPNISLAGLKARMS